MTRMAPRFSIVTPVYEPPVDVLAETLDSVLAQTYGDWELILVDDRSPSDAVRDLLREYAARDPRIVVIERETNGHIVAASNDGIAAARGEFIALLDHDDLLEPHALERYAALLDADEEVDYLYCDEDKIDADGRHYDLFRKPVWSPERLRGQNYVCHFSVIRADLVREVGGFREGYDGSQDHDLTLRVTELCRKVVHVPEVLYHWRVVPGSAAGAADAKPYAAIAGRQAVQDQLDRLGVPARVEMGAHPGLYVIERDLDPDLKVSLIVPTKGSTSLVWGTRRVLVVEAMRSVVETTTHENLEFVIVHDADTPESVLDDLRDLLGDRLRLVLFDHPFNFSWKCNLGALHATGDRLVFLNDDLEFLEGRWLENLVAPLDDPAVGMTGAKLFFSNTTIQHAGHAYDRRQYLHAFINTPRQDPGPFGVLLVNREASGVTGACMALRPETFLEVGGFTEHLPLNFNDVDLCYKVRHAGYRIVFVANAEAFHFESRTRVNTVERWEKMLMVGRWGWPMADPYLPGS